MGALALRRRTSVGLIARNVLRGFVMNVTTVIFRRFYACKIEKHLPRKAPYLVEAIERSNAFQRKRDVFERPSYTQAETVGVASWLNEREAGYPVPGHIKHLWSPAYDKARSTKSKHTARATRRAGRKPRHVPRKR